MSDSICIKYDHNFQLDLDGQVTCSVCGAMDDEREAGFSTGKWSDDDDMGITPFLGPNR
jgi:hypothetical protein